MTYNLYLKIKKLREQRELLRIQIYELEEKLEDSKSLNYSIIFYTSLAIGFYYLF